MFITSIKNCPFEPTHIKGKRIRKVFFNAIAIAF